MKERYLICGAGRTGSHILLTYFARCGIPFIHLNDNDTFVNKSDSTVFKENKELVIHYHGMTFLPHDLEKYTVIISYRNDIFDQYCSHLISIHTKETRHYSKPIDSLNLNIDLENAVNYSLLLYNYNFIVQKNMIKTLPWKKIVYLSYEDVNDNVENFLQCFENLRDRYDESTPTTHISERSPYVIKEEIINYQNMKNRFYQRFLKKLE